MWKSHPIHKPKLVFYTFGNALSMFTSRVMQVKSHTAAHGKDANGDSLGLTN